MNFLLGGYKRYAKYMLQSPPQAVAHLRGSPAYPELTGTVSFFPVPGGVLVVAEVRGLPATADGFFGLHIHDGTACTGDASDPFAGAKTHYNPAGSPHPQHAGDLPPLLFAGGRAYACVLTDRFTISDILGKTVVLHDHPDDFRTQPAGDSGAKIACGVIYKR